MHFEVYYPQNCIHPPTNIHTHIHTHTSIHTQTHALAHARPRHRGYYDLNIQGGASLDLKDNTLLLAGGTLFLRSYWYSYLI